MSEVIESTFEDEGITVRTEAPVTALSETDDDIRVDADGADTITVSDVLLAAGRTPNTDGLRLEDVGVSLDDRGFVETDDGFETTADGVYAIGDVSGQPMFTHSARDDADLLYRHLAKDEEVSTEGRTAPWAVFTDPQVGHVGLTEREAREAGYDVSVGRQDFAEQGKPKALGETEGFVKLVTDAETDELLGAHIVGEQGAEIVHEFVLAIELGATADDIANTMHIQPDAAGKRQPGRRWRSQTLVTSRNVVQRVLFKNSVLHVVRGSTYEVPIATSAITSITDFR